MLTQYLDVVGDGGDDADGGDGGGSGGVGVCVGSASFPRSKEVA